MAPNSPFVEKRNSWPRASTTNVLLRSTKSLSLVSGDHRGDLLSVRFLLRRLSLALESCMFTSVRMPIWIDCLIMEDQHHLKVSSHFWQLELRVHQHHPLVPERQITACSREAILVVGGLVSRRRHLLLGLVLGPTIEEVALLMEEVLLITCLFCKSSGGRITTSQCGQQW